MIHQIKPNLWLGGMACDPDELDASGITAVLNVAVEVDDKTSGYRIAERRLFVKVGLVDGPGNDPAWIRFACWALANLLDQGHIVYVHCQAGLSRAPYVAALVLSGRQGCTFDVAYDQIRIARECVTWPSVMARLYGTDKCCRISAEHVPRNSTSREPTAATELASANVPAASRHRRTQQHHAGTMRP